MPFEGSLRLDLLKAGRQLPAARQIQAGPVRRGSEGQVYAQRRAQPSGSRPRGNNPQTGVARPRGGSGRRRATDRVGPTTRRVRTTTTRRVCTTTITTPIPAGTIRTVMVGSGWVTSTMTLYVWGNSWGFSGYYGSGYGYGATYGYGAGYPGYAAYPGYAGYPGYDVGKLRLQMQPRDAEVYIDGAFSGVVDDFDGRLQGLTLETGGYGVEVVAPGFEPLKFDIRITPGRTTTYRGELLPQRP